MDKKLGRKALGFGLLVIALVANGANALLDKKEHKEIIVEEVHKELAKLNLPTGNTEA